MSMKKLTQKDVDKVIVAEKNLEKIKKSAQDKLEKAEQVITDRIVYILKTMCNVLGMTYNTGWNIEQAGNYDWNSEDANAQQKIKAKFLKDKSKYIMIYMGFATHTDHFESVIIDKNGKTVYLDEGIPKRWLFEDFEEELIFGARKQKAKQKLAKQKENEKLLKIKKEEDAWLGEVKTKLTKKEWEKLQNHFRGY